MPEPKPQPSNETNPYLPPQLRDQGEASGRLHDAGASCAELDERVRKLEERVHGTNLTHRRIVIRCFVVLGHFLLAYLMIAAVVWLIMLLVMLFTAGRVNLFF